MHITFTFKNFSASEKMGFETYFSTKVEKIAKAALTICKEPILDIHAEKFVKNSAYKVSFHLHGTPDVMASEDDHTIQEAIDLAENKLIANLRKLKDKMKSR